MVTEGKYTDIIGEKVHVIVETVVLLNKKHVIYTDGNFDYILIAEGLYYL